MTPSLNKLFALIACALAITAHAQTPVQKFPSKSIRMIVPLPPGGSNDIIGRFIGQKLSERVGQQVVIDNRGGADGIIGSEKRSPLLPEVLTLLESGVSGYDAGIWWGFLAAAGLPPDIQARLHGEVVAVLRDPEASKRLAAEAAEPATTSPDDFMKVTARDIVKWGQVAKQANIRVH
jgi:tripartite-type tricarboxylate transporter receptor subunit TctC